MTTATFSDEALMIARLRELVDRSTSWHRSLWQIGGVLALREGLEYAEGVRSGVAKSEGLAYVAQSAAVNLRRDFGLGGGDVRAEVVRILECAAHKTDGVLNRSVAASLDQLIRRADRDYLSNWLKAHERGDVTSKDVELMSRAVVAHLLDAGFAPDHVHGWLLASSGGTATVTSVISKADEMCRRDPVEYEVWVPFTRLSGEIVASARDRFLGWEAFVALLEGEDLPELKAREGVGALRFSVVAREPTAAVAAAEIEIRRLAARAAVGLAAGAVDPVGAALVVPASKPRWRDLKSRQREILVSSITRHALLMPASRTSDGRALDDAFELLAAAETATSWTSVAAMWAAVEGLLTQTGDPGVAAADRMAAVVAGGFARAELTQLVDVLATGDGDLAELLNSNVRLTTKMDAVSKAVARGEELELDNPIDAAAVARVRNLLDDPAAAMSRVQGYYKDAFRRLYMQRNLLLHGGRFDSVALPATMRTLPPLVAAGLDRLVHAAMQSPSTDPFGLAARASNELALLGKNEARSIHRLLE